MDFVSLNGATIRIDTRKLHILAEIVAAVVTEEALLARDTGFNSDSVSRLKVHYTFATLQHNTCCFVADNTVIFKNQCMNPTGLPEMDIGPCQVSTDMFTTIYKGHTRRCPWP